MARRKRIRPSRVVTDPFVNPPWVVRRGFGRKERERVYRRVIYGLEAGRDIGVVLDLVLQHETDDGRTSGGAVGKAMRNWVERLGGGARLSEAMEGWVPPAHVFLVAAGEEGGSISDAMRAAVYIDQSQRKLNAAVLGGVLYPIGLGAMVILLLVVFNQVVLPQFEQLSDPETWGGAAAVLHKISKAMQPRNAIVAGIAVVALAVVLVRALPRWKGKTRDAMRNIWPFNIYRLIWGTSFLLSVGALVEAGRSVSEALELMQRNARPWYRDKLLGVQTWMGQGLAFGQACWLADKDFPDREVVREMRAFDRLEGQLERLARQYLEDSVVRMEVLGKLSKNLGMAAMALVIVMIVLGVLDITESLQDSGFG